MWNSTEIMLDFGAYTYEVNVSVFKYKYTVSGWDDLISFIADCMIV